MTSLSNSSQITRPVGRVLGENYLSFLDFTRNYKRMSGIFVPCIKIFVLSFFECPLKTGFTSLLQNYSGW